MQCSMAILFAFKTLTTEDSYRRQNLTIPSPGRPLHVVGLKLEWLH